MAVSGDGNVAVRMKAEVRVDQPKPLYRETELLMLFSADEWDIIRKAFGKRGSSENV